MIADDHSLVVGALRTLFASMDDVEVVAEAANGLEAVAAVKRHKPTLITLDIAMPLARGTEVLNELKRWSPDTRIAIVTGLTSQSLLSGLVDSDVGGVFLKSCPPDVLEQGLLAILQGHHYIAPEVATLVGTAEDAMALGSLTERERQVLGLVADGHTNGVIAERLFISPKTVDKHRSSLMKKLGVHSVAELLALALREGLLEHHQSL